MSTYTYSAVDQHGKEIRGTLQVPSQAEALKQIKDMGFYPLKLSEVSAKTDPAARAMRHASRLGLTSRAVQTRRQPRSPRRVRGRVVTLFTRQLSTLLEAGMPLLRSLRLLHEQETHPGFKQVLASLGASIEGGSSFSEALAQHPRIFDRLYLNLIKAGEVAGVLEMSLKRLADFMEKSSRLKGKIKTAMFYPAAVITVAIGVMALMLLFIVPRFKDVFSGLSNGQPLPAFTRFVLGVSDVVMHNFVSAAVVLGVAYAFVWLAIQTGSGRRCFDALKLRLPVLGPVFKKIAIARFARNLSVLITSGVPILQALTIIKEATGNVVVGRFVGRVHDNVEQGESIVGPLRESGIFPAMVVGMIDVGEQTGALPEMLGKIADNYDEEVDNAVTAMTSLLEPIMIVFLGVVVGSIVIAMFLPLVSISIGGNGEGSQ